MDNIIKDIYEKIVPPLKKLFEDHKVGKDHDISHALLVMNNCKNAILESKEKYSIENTQNMLLASILHDADDHKLFSTKNNDNLKKIMKIAGYSKETIMKVVEMVELVSSSKNGDRLPKNKKDYYKVIPRYSDRLEAIGMIGIARTFSYTIHKNQKLYCYDSPRPETIDEINMVATIERYNEYKGNSKSMIDHFYDKLIRVCDFPIENPFFERITRERKNEIINFILFFGRQGKINNDDCKNYIKLYNPEIYFELELYKL